MRISDWSSDVCSSDLKATIARRGDALTVIYGIRNCDTMKKARAWLDAHGVSYDFHDYKAAGIDAGTLRGWAGVVGWEALLNRAGTTFRKRPDADKAGLDEARANGMVGAHKAQNQRQEEQGAGKAGVRTGGRQRRA